jgi:cell division protein FtsB
MSKIKELFLFIKGHLNKYVVAILIFVVISLFGGESSVINRVAYDQQIKELKAEIQYYSTQKEENMNKLEALHSDNESIERLAREQYQMTKPDEELFIVK